MTNREYRVALTSLLKRNRISQREYDREVSELDFQEDMAEAQLRSAIREYMEACTRSREQSVLALYRVVKDELEKRDGA